MNLTIPPIDLRELRCFLVVAEEGNISRAASRLNMTQPPLTRIIHTMEKTLGGPLFVRSARGVTLTPSGQALYADAQRLLSMTQAAVERSRRTALGFSGHLSLSGFGALMLDAVPLFLAHFRALHPEITLSLETLSRGEQVQALRDGRIDLAFTRQSFLPPDIASQPLAKEELIAALHNADPLADHPAVRLEELEGRTLITQGSGPRPNFTDVLLPLCSEAGWVVQTIQPAGDSLTAIALVASGFGVALVAQSATNLRLPDVKFVKVTDAPTGIVDLQCMYHRDHRNPAVAIFLKEVADFYQRDF